MKRTIAVLMSALVLAACQKHAADAVNGGSHQGKVGQIDPRLAESTNRFGFNLLQELGGVDSASGTMISPASIAMALAMAYNGADGTTKSQMADVMQVAGLSLEEVNTAHKQLREVITDPTADVTLSIANSLWGRQNLPFNTAFLARNREYFAARITNLDFDNPAAVDTINRWVKESTREKIPSIVDKIERQTILFLINAIYFKGIWTYQFNPDDSYDRIFHHPTGDRSHKFMRRWDDFEYLDGDGFTAVRMPYGKSQRFGMYVFLPDEGSTIDALAADLTVENWKTWTSGFSEREGEVHFPRLKLTYEAGLNDVLKQLGMTEAFDGERADFTGIIDLPNANAFISRVKHKTFMEINEEGTEAAAATSVEFGITSIRDDGPFRMIVDRPFFCAIADKESGLILFMGKVSEFE